jgi:hypothetical protein
MISFIMRCGGLISLLLLSLIVDPVAAQELKPAVFGAVGFANVSRAEDQSFGTKLNVAVGVGVEWKRLGLDVEVHRTLGLTPGSIDCGVVDVPCNGSAREGILEAMVLSANVSYYFGNRRVRPYVVGTIGVLWTESLYSLTIATSTMATISEGHQRDTGLAVGAGFGLDIPLSASFSLRPEFRTYSSVLMSRVNVGVHRGSIGVRYRW